MPKTNPFPDFAPFAPNVFYYHPPKPTKAPPSPPVLSASYVIVPPTAPKKEVLPPPSPDVIIICPWMNAAPKHIQKYINSYRALYSSAKIVVITSETLDVTFRSRKTQKERLAPVLDILAIQVSNDTPRRTRRTGQKEEQPPKILLHFFSNGGSHSARLLSRCYEEKYSKPLPLIGTIIDSAPSAESYSLAVKAFAAGIPKTLPYPLYLLALLAVHISIIFMFVFGHWAAVLISITTVQSAPVSWLEQLCRDVNDKSLFPRGAPRTYIFSDSDELVEEESPRRHAADAKKKGFKNVKLEKFTGTPHVGHMMGDSKRYWGIVETLVRDGTVEGK
jgi:hypothetical protein